MSDFSPELIDLAKVGRAWPFEEARKIVERAERLGKTSVLLETGYGPSGLPHIGTFGEVARTAMVRHALRVMTNDKLATQLYCFSDDMDGLRKVPDNVPNQDRLAHFIDQPLTKVPDPFGTHPSFGEHNNARLKSFLDSFHFDYTFVSSTETYMAGTFDEALRQVARHYETIMAIMLPSLREERQKTYSPIFPLCPKTGKVLQVPLTGLDADEGRVSYLDPETQEEISVSLFGGHCKLQWKADWAMRWYALGIDYEMSGKDLIDSFRLASKICRALGGPPPEGLSYEHFLDHEGRKISKSKGNGLSVEEWLTYAPQESLGLFMYQRPRQAKRLFFDVIPRQVDDYYSLLQSYSKQDMKEKIENPVWHLHQGRPPLPSPAISFSMLLNLVSAANTHDKDSLWGFIRRYDAELSPETAPELDRLTGFAITYYHDFVAPAKTFKVPDERERKALEMLLERLKVLPDSADGEAIQNHVYDVGKLSGFDPLRDWFKSLYQVLFGQDQGPRFGSFVALYGVKKSEAMIAEALARQ